MLDATAKAALQSSGAGIRDEGTSSATGHGRVHLPKTSRGVIMHNYHTTEDPLRAGARAP
jgi:hypothetical protein